MAGRPAHAHRSRSAAIGSGRTPPCSSRRRATLGKAGSSTSARGSARSASRSLSATRLPRSILSSSIPSWLQLADSNAARNGLQARTRVLRLDALNSRERREAGLAELASCVVTNPPFFDAQRGPRLSRCRQSARAYPGRRRGERDACRLDSGLPCDARARRAVRDDPPARRAERDPRGDWRPARRAGASAGSSDDRRERASSACFGRQGLQSPACALRRGSSCMGPTAG